MKTSIIERCLALWGDLTPTQLDRTPTRSDVEALVEGEGCGLRPARKGGVRLESEEIAYKGKMLAMIHNYG